MVTINGKHELFGLVDSGSSVCILKESVGRRWGLNWEKDSSSITAFGVNAETVTVGRAILSLKTDEVILDNVDVYIMPDASHPLDLLIGRPWCQAPEISYVKHENTLTYYNTVSFPYLTTNFTNGKHVEGRLTLCEGKRIEAKNTVMVTAVLSGERVQVPVRNQTDYPIEVQANALLARRATIIRTQTSVPELIYRPLTYDDVKKPEALTVIQQAETVSNLFCFIHG